MLGHPCKPGMKARTGVVSAGGERKEGDRERTKLADVFVCPSVKRSVTTGDLV